MCEVERGFGARWKLNETGQAWQSCKNLKFVHKEIIDRMEDDAPVVCWLERVETNWDRAANRWVVRAGVVQNLHTL